MPPKSMKDKMEAEVRKIARLDGNKMCADCTERVITKESLISLRGRGGKQIA